MFSGIDADLEGHQRGLRERYGITNEWIEELLAKALTAAGDTSR